MMFHHFCALSLLQNDIKNKNQSLSTILPCTKSLRKNTEAAAWRARKWLYNDRARVYIGVDFALWAKKLVRKAEKYSMD